MKASNLIILALAVTLFVACSKKKDGDSGQYQNQNGYGLTPNDIYGTNGGYYHGGGAVVYGGGYYPPAMPGYQLNQGGCNGPIYSDQVSYCGWLAQYGESMCNPMVVRQAFLERCQGFSTRFNYCQQQVSSGCYYGGGCHFSDSTELIRFTPHKRPQYLDDNTYHAPAPTPAPTPTPTPVHQQPPVVSHPPVVVKHPQQICFANKSKDCKYPNGKKKGLICKLPNDSTAEGNYVYNSYEEYLDAVNKECFVQGSNVSEVTEQSVASDDQKNNVDDSSGFAQSSRPVEKIESGDNSLDEAVSNSGGETQKSTTATEVKNKVSSCLNLEALNKIVLDPKNELSSWSVFSDKDSVLLKKKVSRALKSHWAAEVKAVELSHYRGSTSGKDNDNLTAIGESIKQSKTNLSMDRNYGTILECKENLLVAIFSNEEYTFSSNGIEDLNDLAITVTKRGIYTYNNKESSPYILTRIVRFGKNLTEQEVSKKIEAEKKRLDD
jgi:hypothetical protein